MLRKDTKEEIFFISKAGGCILLFAKSNQSSIWIMPSEIYDVLCDK